MAVCVPNCDDRGVTGTARYSHAMRQIETPKEPVCPFVPLSLVPMTTRGDRIRRARQLRGLRQTDLAAAAGVNVRTLSRIETGGVRDSKEIPVLETYLGIETTTDPIAEGRLTDAAIEAALDQASGMQLLVQFAKRLARLDGHDITLPNEALGWAREDSARQFSAGSDTAQRGQTRPTGA